MENRSSVVPEFSVLMVNYNNDKYIEESIESVILQNHVQEKELWFQDLQP